MHRGRKNSQSKYSMNTDGLESLAVSTGPAAVGLNHTELHKKASSLCGRWDGHLEHVLR